MSLLFIAATVTASIPALFFGINNGITLVSVMVMAFSSYKILASKA